MKLLRFITVCAAVSLVAATAGFAQHVQTDFDHHANFGQYKTYSWQEIKPGASLWDSRAESKGRCKLCTTASAAVGDGAGLAASASQPQPSRITRKASWSSTYTTGRRSS